VRASIWGEMPLGRRERWVILGVRKPLGAKPSFGRRGWRWSGGGWGCLESDGEAELFELGDETASAPLGILARGEVVVT
jgi:hypothetical protein